MANIQQSLIVPYTSAQMYELVNNIEDYPAFLPWCTQAKIHTRSTTMLEATLSLSKGPMQQQITTRNNMVPDQKIIMQYIAGPFKSCNGLWEFTTLDAQNSQVSFNMQYEFINKIIGFTLEPIFAPIAKNLIAAFMRRAEQIYVK